MSMGEQIDKLSKKFVRLSAESKSYAKRLHKRFLRRQAKANDELAPKPNRYSGWIG